MSKRLDIEKDHAESNSRKRKHSLHDNEATLKEIHTAGHISITSEIFEKLCLSNQVPSTIQSTFGNPTPIALVGFLLSLSPLSNVLLGWRGAGDFGAAEVGVYYFFGGLLMLLGAVLEFSLGNTFLSVVFSSFGAFWLSLGATLTPYFNASIAYDPAHPGESLTNPAFAATFAYFLVYMGVLSFIYMIVALRTNIVFVLIFVSLVAAFSCLSAFFFGIANSDPNITLQHAAGAWTFFTCLLGWYLFAGHLLAAVDFPHRLPVGDLSHLIKGASEWGETG